MIINFIDEFKGLEKNESFGCVFLVFDNIENAANMED